MVAVLLNACGGGGGSSSSNNSEDIAPVSSNGLVAYYNFENNIKDTISNMKMSISNSIYYTDGKFNQGIGSTDASSVDQIQILNPFSNESFTLSFWNNFLVEHNKIYGDTGIHVWHSTNRNQRSFMFTPSSGNHSLYHQHEYPELAVNDNKNNAGNGDSFYYGGSQLMDQKWQHVALTYDHGMINIYVNGNKIIQNKRTIISPIGRNLGISLRGEDKIDDLKIYNRTLNEVEIQELYNLIEK